MHCTLNALRHAKEPGKETLPEERSRRDKTLLASCMPVWHGPSAPPPSSSATIRRANWKSHSKFNIWQAQEVRTQLQARFYSKSRNQLGLCCTLGILVNVSVFDLSLAKVNCFIDVFSIVIYHQYITFHSMKFCKVGLQLVSVRFHVILIPPFCFLLCLHANKWTHTNIVTRI